MLLDRYFIEQFQNWDTAEEYLTVTRDVILMKQLQIESLKREVQSLRQEESSLVSDYVMISKGKHSDCF